MKTLTMIRALRNDRRAVTALEYGIIAGVFGLTLIAIFHSFAGKELLLFSTIGGKI
jgi:Flp pilus assembly pilin Flp